MPACITLARSCGGTPFSDTLHRFSTSWHFFTLAAKETFVNPLTTVGELGAAKLFDSTGACVILKHLKPRSS